MIRKAPSDPTFHPSLDEPHWIGDETASGQGVLLDQGEGPARQTMFGVQSGPEGEDPQNVSRLRPPPDSRKLGWEIERLGTQTVVPVKDWQRGRGDVNLTDVGVNAVVPGWYQHGDPPTIGMRSGVHGDTETLVHEMGHARHYEDVTIDAERSNPTKLYKDRRGWSPDPLKEAIADAYVDRYGGRHSAHAKMATFHRDAVAFATEHDFPEMPDPPAKYDHISRGQFGYSSNYEEGEGRPAWNNTDRALYAGVRAHFDATGEFPRYQPVPKGSVEGAAADATVAMLHEHSPHARAAWEALQTPGEMVSVSDTRKERQTRSYTDVANEAIRRHMDRQLMTHGQEIQESLFGEPELARNQFGERPRTLSDLSHTIFPEVSKMDSDDMWRKLHP